MRKTFNFNHILSDEIFYIEEDISNMSKTIENENKVLVQLFNWISQTESSNLIYVHTHTLKIYEKDKMIN